MCKFEFSRFEWYSSNLGLFNVVVMVLFYWEMIGVGVGVWEIVVISLFVFSMLFVIEVVLCGFGFVFVGKWGVVWGEIRWFVWGGCSKLKG